MNKLNSDQSAQLHSIGSFLQQRRLELGVSLDEIATKTRIRVTLLQAIENGDGVFLPEPIYIKGLIRSYGNILQVDGDTLAETFPLEITPVVSEIINHPQKPSLAEYIANMTLSLKPHGSKILLVGGTVVGLAVVLFLRQPVMEAIAKIRPNSSPKVEANKSTSPAAIVAQPAPAASTNNATTTNPDTLPSGTTVGTTTNANLGVEATINLSADSWLQISIDGKVEFEGILGKGTERKFVGKEKIIISAGNAGAVAVSVNREPAKPLGNPGEVKEAIFNASRQ